MSENRSTEQAALLGIARAIMAISLAAAGALPLRVSVLQFRALNVLSTRVGANLAELAAAVGLSASATSRLCDRLVDAGWVSRELSPRTRREITLELTGAGRELLTAYDDRRLAALTAAIERLPPRRRATVVAALHDFAQAAHPTADARDS